MLPLNALMDRRKRFRMVEPVRPKWMRPTCWPDEQPPHGPVTLLVQRCDEDTYWRGHAHWLMDVTWAHGWHCYHDALDSRSVVRTAQIECVKDVRGHRARTVRVRRLPPNT